MNIFVLDKSPSKAAKMLCDKHINKMVLESAQMLCTAHWMRGSQAPYKSTHKNHPCNKWVRKSYGNYNWLLKHALAIAKEYKRRYKREHKTFEILKWCEKNKPKLKQRKRTKFVQAMPERYKDKDPVKAYKKYYIGEKLRFCKWNHSRKPDFVVKYENVPFEKVPKSKNPKKTKKWVQTIKTVSTFPPEGIFTKNAETIAKVMARKDVSPKGIGSAIKMIQYFINRGGKGLSKERKRELEKAKKILQKMKK